MKQQRLFALVLSLALTAAMCVPALAAEDSGWLVPKLREYSGQFADVTAETWCAAAVETVYEAGLMEGKTADAFDITGNLTEAQRLVIGVRLHALLHGKTVEGPAPGEAWWMPSARYYLAVDGDTTNTPTAFAEFANQPANRVSFAHQLVWSTPAEDLPAINVVEEIPDLTKAMAPDDSLRQPVLTLYQAGILNGVDKWGKFDPQGTLTRGQAAAMLARAIDPEQRLHFELPEFDLCRDVLGMNPNTVLLTVDGTSFSADLFSVPLAAALTVLDPQTALQRSVDAAVEDIALERLSAQREVSPNLVINPTNIAVHPLPGESADSVQWRRSHEILLDLLSLEYGGTNSFPSSSIPKALSRDLSELAASMKTVVSPALQSLDLAAVQTRLLASPYCY